MTTISDYIKRVKKVKEKILDETERIIYANELKIIQLNTSQIDNFIGVNGQPLESNIEKYSGVYTIATQLFASTENLLAPKIAGEQYNFLATGDFMKSFEVEINSRIDRIYIRNTGTGAGDKKLFFDSYPLLLGLTKENAYRLNYEIIKPELDKFIKNAL